MIRRIIIASCASILLSAGHHSAIGSTAECKNLPPSRLRIYNVDTPKIDEEVAPVRELLASNQNSDLVSKHTAALKSRNLIGLVRIIHRAIPQPDGMVCDAPVMVDLGFGSSARKLILADILADNACVKREMTDHEAAHSAAFNTTIDHFIRDHESALKEGMIALKKTPSSDFGRALAMWDKGLQLIVDKSKRALLADLVEANAAVDSQAALNLPCS